MSPHPQAAPPASRRRFRRRFRLLATVAVVVTAFSLATVVQTVDGAAASTAGVTRGGPGRAVAAVPTVDFGCGNPLNRNSSALRPAAAELPASDGVRCFGLAKAARGGLGPQVTKGPKGYSPAMIRQAYRLPAPRTVRRTVAIVTAYDDPRAEQDLAVYRKTFGLPACTSANGCFRKVNTRGNPKPLPTVNAGWAEETSLDLDAVSASCPGCRILLVEAGDSSIKPLMTAVDSALRLHAFAVSNSYGGAENPYVVHFDKHFDHPDTPIVVATGDDGYGVNWPASSPYVTAVSGTELRRADNSRGWTETAWQNAGSGCSRYEPKPSWQHDSGCKHRTVADVAADADPATGLAVYDTVNTCGSSTVCDESIERGNIQGLDGWATVGGTSLAAPLVAGMYALAGRTVDAARWVYRRRSYFNDLDSGRNGVCKVAYLCKAGNGYDGPTGVGSPRGLGGL